MKIVQLKIDSFKRIKTATIVPTSQTVQITGANASGKSSTLDAIVTALGGKRNAPEDPVHHGDEVARITLDLGEIIVKWHCKQGKTPVLVVESVDGARYPSPQAMLDKLYGELTFDPLEFLRMDEKAQRQVLADLTGLTFDLSEIKADRDKLFADRTVVNREEKNARAVADTIPYEEVQEEDTAALLEQLSVIEKHNADANDERVSLAQAEREIAQNERHMEECEQKIKNLLGLIDKAKTEIATRRHFISSVTDSLKVPQDDTEIRRRLAEASATNARAAKQRQRKVAVAQANKQKEIAEALTAQIDALDAKAHELVAQAPFPVEGLSLTDDGVLYNNVLFKQASSAEKIRVSCAIARALNPNLRILLIKDGSLLDRKMFKALTEDPALADYQIWMERVDESGKVGIYLEDGEVVAVDGVPNTQEEA